MMTAFFAQLDTSMSEMNEVRTKIVPRIFPLAITGCTPLMYHQFKRFELIDFTIEKSKGKWVKLNLMEVVWLKLLLKLKGFGVGVDQLKQIRHQLIVHDESLRSELIEIAKEQVRELDFDSPELKGISISDIIKEVDQNFDEAIGDESGLLLTTIGVCVTAILTKHHQIAVYIYQNESGLETSIYTNQMQNEFNKQLEKVKRESHIYISINEMVEEVLGEDPYQKYLTKCDVFTNEETDILEEFKKKTIREITLTKLNNEQYTISIIEEEDVLGEKVKYLKKALGLKDYKKIEIKTRNDKHLIVTKTRSIRKNF